MKKMILNKDFVLKAVKSPFLIVAACLLAVFIGYKSFGSYKKHVKHSKGFSVDKITSKMRYRHAWDVMVTDEQKQKVDKILDQPYFFLGKGKQCYAFESADGKYVLKFFQHQRFEVKKVVTKFPDFFLSKRLVKYKRKNKKDKRDELFQSFLIAKELASESGVLFVHLNRTKKEYANLTVLDKKGKLFKIKLDDVQFVLQTKASLLKPILVQLMYEGKEEEAKKRISQIFELLVKTAQNEVYDKDGALIRNNNLGFLGDHAIFIDTGKLVHKKEIAIRSVFAKSLKRLQPLHKWLKKNYPDLSEHFEEEKKEAIDSF